MSLNKLTKPITEWGIDKGILSPNVQNYYISKWNNPPAIDDADADHVEITVARAKAQLDKTIEEVKELEAAIMNALTLPKELKNNEIKDAIGDIYVTLVMQAGVWGLEIEECGEYAYTQIKDRKGKMVKGVFVKEEKEEEKMTE